jgi:outer membrane protein OmpU
MKKTLLTTTALVALAGAATAEITVSGTARIGLQTTEGTAAVKAGANGKATTQMVTDATAANGAAAVGALANDTVATADDLIALDAAIAASEAAAAADVDKATQDAENVKTGTLKAIKAALTGTAAVAKTEDSTTAKNRVRIKFGLSGETDSGLEFGASIRADNAAAGNSGTGGSQYLSGSFGKISMGDLNGADEDMVGDISAMSLGGLGSNQEHSYQSSSHNLAYSTSMAGISFGVSTDAGGGSSTAMGLKWSGDLGGGTVTVGLGQSSVGGNTETSISASLGMGGFTGKILSSTNDNGPVVVKEVAAVAATIAYVAEIKTPDTKTMGFSLSYNIDALTITAYNKTMITTGTKDKGYSGVGVSYDLGGMVAKAGVADADGQSVMDFGVSFSF